MKLDRILFLVTIICTWNKISWAKTTNEVELIPTSKIQLKYNFIKNNIIHQEKSDDVNFRSFDKTSDIFQHRLTVAYEKEIFSKRMFSASFTIGLGGMAGEEALYEQGATKSLNSVDRVSGYFGQVGVSLNYNYYYDNHKIQVFIGSFYENGVNTYFLRYEDENLDARSFEIEYTEELNINMVSFGLRFYNFTKKTAATIAVDAMSYSQDSFESKATQGKDELKLTELATLERTNTSLTLGFGFLF